jgi:hypothetical protein
MGFFAEAGFADSAGFPATALALFFAGEGEEAGFGLAPNTASGITHISRTVLSRPVFTWPE